MSDNQNAGRGPDPATFFSKDDFLSSLPSFASGSKGRFPKSLYKRFIESRNFGPWLESVVRALREQKRAIHRHLIFMIDSEEALFRAVGPHTNARELELRVRAALAVEQARVGPDRDEALVRRMEQHLEVVVRRPG